MRGRLARALGITAAVSVALTAVITLLLVRRFALDEALRQLRRDGNIVATELETLGPGQAAGLPAELRIAGRLLRASGDHLAQVGPRGRVNSDDATAAAVANAIDLAGVRAGRRIEGTVATNDGQFAYVAIPGRRPGTAIVLSRSVGVAREIAGSVATRVLLAGAAVVIAAVIVSFVIARRMSARLQHVADATARVASGDLSERIPVEGDDEIADLARRFNAMAESLSEAQRREREFLASVSHELRTPLTAIRGYAEAISDGTARGDAGRGEALDVIRAETSRLERLVEDVMDLARLGAREFRLEPADVDLAPVLDDAARAHSAAASDAGVSLDAQVLPGLVVFTDPSRVRQIVSNLVENALRVTPSGGAIQIAGRSESGGVSIEVADTGPGIAAADLPHVFERSYLFHASKGVRPVGTGLGLAIVRELASALSGKIDVVSEPGRGTTFRLWLPARVRAGIS